MGSERNAQGAGCGSAKDVAFVALPSLDERPASRPPALFAENINANTNGGNMKYRKKPVVIEATQWLKNGDHPDDNCDMFDYPDGKGNVFQRPGEGKVVRYFRRPDKPGADLCDHCMKTMHVHGWIDTKEGGHIVCPGDWVITGVQGEMYPCKPDIFEATYDPVAA